MPLPPGRVLVEGKSPYDWELEAIQFIKAALPATDPYHLWALVDLPARDGRIHQIDALVLGYHALYLVEVKSWPGKLTGTFADWKVTFPDGKSVLYENPMPATAQKARVLASLLAREIDEPALRPWVEPLVFLSHPDVSVQLPESARGGVVTRHDFARAVTFGEVPLAAERLARGSVHKKVVKETLKAFRKLGLEASKATLKLGEFQLMEVVEDGPGYQDWEAKHPSVELRRRVRIYLDRERGTPERREQLARAAEREASLLTLLGDHRGLLKVQDYRREGPTGAPAIAFEHVSGALQLDVFLRRENPTFAERVAIVQQVGEALACGWAQCVAAPRA